MTAHVLPSLGNVDSLRRIIGDDGTYLGCVMFSGVAWFAYPIGAVRAIGSGSLTEAAAMVAGLARAA